MDVRGSRINRKRLRKLVDKKRKRSRKSVYER